MNSKILKFTRPRKWSWLLALTPLAVVAQDANQTFKEEVTTALAQMIANENGMDTLVTVNFVEANYDGGGKIPIDPGRPPSDFPLPQPSRMAHLVVILEPMPLPPNPPGDPIPIPMPDPNDPNVPPPSDDTTPITNDPNQPVSTTPPSEDPGGMPRPIEPVPPFHHQYIELQPGDYEISKNTITVFVDSCRMIPLAPMERCGLVDLTWRNTDHVVRNDRSESEEIIKDADNRGKTIIRRSSRSHYNTADASGSVFGLQTVGVDGSRWHSVHQESVKRTQQR